MNWFSTNSMFINSTYIPLCLFFPFFLNICIYLSYFLRNFSFSSRRISISRDYKLSKIAFSKAKNNIIKYFPILQILSRTTPSKINYPSLLDYPKELERKKKIREEREKREEEEEKERLRKWEECWERKFQAQEERDHAECCVDKGFCLKPRTQSNIWINITQDRSLQEIHMAIK